MPRADDGYQAEVTDSTLSLWPSQMAGTPAVTGQGVHYIGGMGPVISKSRIGNYMRISAPVFKHRGTPGQPGGQVSVPEVGFILHLDLSKLLSIGRALR